MMDLRDLVRRPDPAAEDGLSTFQRDVFAGVREALVEHRDPLPAAAVAARRLAEDGMALPEAMDSLRAVHRAARGSDPDFELIRELSDAWAESALSYANTLSCEEPLTGLATLAYLRTRIGELYRCAERDGARMASAYALVVVETPALITGVDRELRLIDVAESLRLVFWGEEVLARVGQRRAVALARRTPALAENVDAVRGLLERWRERQQVRVWIEGLPNSVDAAAHLLDELAR